MITTAMTAEAVVGSYHVPVTVRCTLHTHDLN